MKPSTVMCKECGTEYTFFVLEFAVCPQCGTTATAEDAEDDISEHSGYVIDLGVLGIFDRRYRGLTQSP